jgi:hypothetical protein
MTSCFGDVDDLRPGMRWRREIDSALRGADDSPVERYAGQ